VAEVSTFSGSSIGWEGAASTSRRYAKNAV
jgi:hypothetical protein